MGCIQGVSGGGRKGGTSVERQFNDEPANQESQLMLDLLIAARGVQVHLWVPGPDVTCFFKEKKMCRVTNFFPLHKKPHTYSIIRGLLLILDPGPKFHAEAMDLLLM